MLGGLASHAPINSSKISVQDPVTFISYQTPDIIETHMIKLK